MSISYADVASNQVTTVAATPEGTVATMGEVAGSPVSAHDVAALLRERLPGVPVKKLHKLLYYCQGHHVATFGQPLFTETISAWDMGPVVGTLWFREGQGESRPAPRELTEAQLNTVGYVVSRYGALTGRDLETLTNSEDPWRQADRDRRPGESARIELDWIRDYFATDHEEDQIPLDSAQVREWIAGAHARSQDFVKPDSPEEIRARLANA
jgi:uncharacterized phage-associated protein